ncbi:MAG: hypothetical protein QOJ29_3629 [Thermoleophilaceae bacterium]|nr:hypothetical protein [Thermoleophilaceae bacterium]
MRGSRKTPAPRWAAIGLESIRRASAEDLAANRNLCGVLAAVAGALAALAQAAGAPSALRLVLLGMVVVAALAGAWFHILERSALGRASGPHALERAVPRADMNKPMKFVNRQPELAHLDRLLDRVEQGHGPVIAVLQGLPGVGKSAVGRYWADLVRERFPDGDLVADFSGRRRGASVDVSGVLADFIRRLGPPGAAVPGELSELVARFQALTFDRKLLILLDDVSEPAQVQVLRPSGRQSLVIATSYRPMEELHYHGAELIPVNPLPPERAEDLLVKMAGDFGTAFEKSPADTRTLVDYCGGLALPLCVCAARLLIGAGGRTVRSILADVADEQRRLDYLTGKGEYAGAAVFGFAYADLAPEERLAYRRVALHPGPDIAAAHAALLTGLALPEAADHLDALADTHLLEPQADGRHRFHDLVRLHARECAAQEEPEALREELLAQLVDWYAAGLRQADHALVAERLRLAPEQGLRAAHLPEFPDREQAFAWLEAERSNILAILHSASDREWDDRVWRMVESLWLFHYNRRHYVEWIEATRLGVESARRAGHKDAETRLRTQLAWAFVELGRFGEAHDELDRANRAVVTSTNLQLQGSVREFTGSCYLKEGKYEPALEAFEQAREVFVRLRKQRAVALQDYFIGWAKIGKGDHAGALQTLRRALDTMRRVDDQMFVGRVLLRIGQATVQQGHADAAQEALDEGLAVFQALGMPVEEAETLEQLAAVADARNDHKTAAARRERAHAIYRSLGHPGSGAVLELASAIDPLAV